MKAPYSKIVLITGATSGIGKATSAKFAKQGYNLILTGRRLSILEELKKKYKRKYAIKVKILNFDVRDSSATKKAFNALDSNWKKIDILINNAGLAKGFDPIHKGKLVDWETMIDTNVKGLLYMTRLVSPGMVKRGSGHIINICSTAGHEVYPKGNVYCATKHAVDALTKGMRLDLTQYGLKVSQISPGAVEETEFSLNRFDGDKNKAKIYEDYNPLTSRDVARTIYFVASQPQHVNIQDVLMMGRQQASSTQIHRTGRD